MSERLHRVPEVRAYMASIHRTQAAFLTAENTHVLVQIDRDGDIGIISPEDLIAWKYLRRCRWAFPLIPLV